MSQVTERVLAQLQLTFPERVSVVRPGLDSGKRREPLQELELCSDDDQFEVGCMRVGRSDKKDIVAHLGFTLALEISCCCLVKNGFFIVIDSSICNPLLSLISSLILIALCRSDSMGFYMLMIDVP
jgi:hypothetical protein